MIGPDLPRRGFWAVVSAYAASDAKVLLRMRTPVVFMFLMPAMLALMLGPAVSGDRGGGAGGRSLLGFAVMFSFMTINYVGLALFREFSSRTWLRQATYRPHRLAFLLGKTLPVVVTGLAQLAVFGAIALIALGMPLHGNLGQLALVAVSLVCCGAALGVLLYNLTRSTSAFQSLTFLLLFGMGGLGGAIVVPERLPALSRALSPFTPHYWALRALRESTDGAGAWGPTLQAVALIGAATVVLCGLALATFDYTEEKSALP